MKDIYNEITELVDKNGITLEKAILKTLEEFGELSKEVNRTIGIKRLEGLSEDDIRKNVLEELADTIQNTLSIGVKYGFTYEEIVEALIMKNIKWKNVI